MVWCQDPLIAGLSYYTCCNPGEFLPTHLEVDDDHDEHDSHEDDDIVLDVKLNENYTSPNRQYDVPHPPQHHPKVTSDRSASHNATMWEIDLAENPTNEISMSSRASSVVWDANTRPTTSRTDPILSYEVPFVPSSSNSSNSTTSSSSSSNSSYLSPIPSSPPHSDDWLFSRRSDWNSYNQKPAVPTKGEVPRSSSVPRKRKSYSSRTKSNDEKPSFDIKAITVATNRCDEPTTDPRSKERHQQQKELVTTPPSPTTSAVMCAFPWMMCVYDLDSFCSVGIDSAVLEQQHNLTELLLTDDFGIASNNTAFHSTVDVSVDNMSLTKNCMGSEDSSSRMSSRDFDDDHYKYNHIKMDTSYESDTPELLDHEQPYQQPCDDTTTATNDDFVNHRFCDFANEHNIEAIYMHEPRRIRQQPQLHHTEIYSSSSPEMVGLLSIYD